MFGATKTHLVIAAVAAVYAIGVFHAFHPTINGISTKLPESAVTLFSKWNAKYGMAHSTPSEFLYRLQVFASTHKDILTLRNKFPNTQFGHNLFSSMTKIEKKNNLHGSLPRDESEQPEGDYKDEYNLKAGALSIPKDYLVPNQRPV